MQVAASHRGGAYDNLLWQLEEELNSPREEMPEYAGAHALLITMHRLRILLDVALETAGDRPVIVAFLDETLKEHKEELGVFNAAAAEFGCLTTVRTKDDVFKHVNEGGTFVMRAGVDSIARSIVDDTKVRRRDPRAAPPPPPRSAPARPRARSSSCRRPSSSARRARPPSTTTARSGTRRRCATGPTRP